MDRLENISEILSLRIMGTAIVMLWALFVILDPKQRLKLFLAVAVIAATLSRLVDLEYYADMAKAFFPLLFAFLTLAALMHPGPKRRLPWTCWVLPVLAMVSFFYIRNVIDFQLAFVLRVQWLIITVAGVLVVRTIRDQSSLRYVLEGLALGMFGGVLLTASQFIVDPAHAFSMGFGRFSPYGANSNQISLLYGMSIPLSLYLCITAKSNAARFGYLSIVFLAGLQSALTLSRAAMFIAVLPSAPLIFVLFRHPGVVICAIVGIYLIGTQMLIGLEGFDLEHISTDAVDSRLDHTRDVLDVVEQRPMFGLMFSEFEYSVRDDINAHNAYVDLLYLGGYSLAVPHFALFLYGHYCAWLTWVVRRRSGYDPLAVSMLAMFSACIFSHGFINSTILYPTFIWALFHVIILTFFTANGLQLALQNTVNSHRSTRRIVASARRERLPGLHSKRRGTGATRARVARQRPAPRRSVALSGTTIRHRDSGGGARRNLRDETEG